MTDTRENLLACMDLVERFNVITRDFPRDDSRISQCSVALSKTLVAACTSLQVASDVVDEILANEERYPAPATIRKYLRMLDYVEEDRSKKNAPEEVDAGRRFVEPSAMTDITEELCKRLPKELINDLSVELGRSTGPTNTAEILSKYHSMLQTLPQS